MAQPTRYNLEVRLTINKEEWSGPTTGAGLADESAGGYWNRNTNERLSVDESMELGTMDFMELMTVLAELHKAVSTIPKRGTAQ